MTMIEDKLEEFRKDVKGNFKQDFYDFRKLCQSMEQRILEMEAL